MTRQDRLFNIISHAVFAVLAFYSIRFGMAKMLYADNAYGTMMMINSGDFNLAHGRYTLVFTQLFPMLGIYLGLSLKTILYLYAINFYVLYYAVFLIVVYGLKNAKAGLAIAGTLVLGADLIFYLQTEVLHGLVFGYLFYAYTQHDSYKQNKWWKWPVSALLLFLAFISHMFIAIPLFFIIAFNAADALGEKKKITNEIVLGGLLLLMIWLKVTLVPDDSYEGSFLGNFKNKDIVSKPFSQYVTRFFFANKGAYLVQIVFSVVVAGYYVRNKKWLKTLVFFTALLGYALIANIVFAQGDSQVAMGRIYLPWSLFIFIPLIKDILPELGDRKVNLQAGVFAMAFMYCLGRIYFGGLFFERRYQAMEHACDHVQTLEGNRFYVDPAGLNGHHELMAMWASSCETFMISSIKYPDHAKTIIVADTGFVNTYTNPSDSNIYLHMSFWPVFGVEGFNKQYFRITPGTYAPLSAEYFLSRK